jgi:lambda family phage portal protein
MSGFNDGFLSATPRVSSGAYTAASRSHPDMRAWTPRLGSPDADMLRDQPAIASRSRDLIRNHGVASGALQTLSDNILGTGLWLAPKPDFVRLGKTEAWANAWSELTSSLWKEYADTTHCDAGRSLTLDGLATLAFRGAFYNGDAIALPIWMPDQFSPLSTRIQVIESDRLSNPMNQPDRPNLRGGVECDEYGAPIKYWIQRTHPGDQLIQYSGADFGRSMEWEGVPAFTPWGRRRVIHLHDKERAGQTRAVPALASVLRQFKVLGDYQSAELKAAVVNAMVALVTESTMSQEQIFELFSSAPEMLEEYTDSMNANKRSAVDYTAGGIVPLQMGEKLSSFTPARPSAQYDAFTTSVFRHIATGLNIPYELLMKDFSKTNYSSARASLLEAFRFFTGRRNWMSLYFYQPIYELFLEEKIDRGEIEAPDFYKMRAAYSAAKWYGPGRGWVDPVKEGQAAVLRMQNHLSTLEEECAEQGKDWQQVLRQSAREKQAKQTLGLDTVGVSPSRKPTIANTAPDEGDDSESQNQNTNGAEPDEPASAAVKLPRLAATALPPINFHFGSGAFQVENGARHIVTTPTAVRKEVTKRDAHGQILETLETPVPGSAEVASDTRATHLGPVINVAPPAVNVHFAPGALKVDNSNAAMKKTVTSRDADGRILETIETPIDASGESSATPPTQEHNNG